MRRGPPIGRSSLLSLTFGCFFFDYDLDGLPDIFAANGHVSDDIERVQPRVTYAQRPHLFRNAGRKQFEDVGAQAGAALQRAIVARGAAYSDLRPRRRSGHRRHDQQRPGASFRNDGGNRNNVLRVQTVGTASNRDGIGARVEVSVRGGARLWQIVKTGSSYASQSELPLTFGLGAATGVDGVRVVWPNGRVEAIGALEANQTIVDPGRRRRRSQDADRSRSAESHDRRPRYTQSRSHDSTFRLVIRGA